MLVLIGIVIALLALFAALFGFDVILKDQLKDQADLRKYSKWGGLVGVAVGLLMVFLGMKNSGGSGETYMAV